MIENFYKNYIFLDIIEKNQLFSFNNYEWIFKYLYIRLIKINFKNIKKKSFRFSLFSLEKLTGKKSYINLYLYNKKPFFFFFNTIKYPWYIGYIFHIFEKYIYNENIFFILLLWKYSSNMNYSIIKLMKLPILSKKFKFLQPFDYLEIIYLFTKNSLNISHLTLFLPYSKNY